MKKSLVLFLIFLTPILIAQDLEQSSMFSKVYFGVMGGTNFNTLPTAGTAKVLKLNPILLQILMQNYRLVIQRFMMMTHMK